MQPLPELQSQLARALREPGAASPPIRANGLSAARRLQVYRHNYESALLSALRAVYPVTERLVGEGFFSTAAMQYLKQDPSRSGNIQDYGAAFPAFLGGYAPAVDLPYLSDVAALEWRRLEAALAPAHTPMDIKALAEVPTATQPRLHFRLQPAAGIFESRFPVLSIWQFCQQAEPEGELDLGLGSQCVLLSRPALDVQMRLVSAGEHAFLLRIEQGGSFEVACSDALAMERGFDVEKRFATLVREEILTGFHL
jgi:hypothetical protein